MELRCLLRINHYRLADQPLSVSQSIGTYSIILVKWKKEKELLLWWCWGGRRKSRGIKAHASVLMVARTTVYGHA